MSCSSCGRMQHILFQPQHTVLVDADGQLLTDYVGRVEEMQASYDAICARIGIPTRAAGAGQQLAPRRLPASITTSH